MEPGGSSSAPIHPHSPGRRRRLLSLSSPHFPVRSEVRVQYSIAYHPSIAPLLTSTRHAGRRRIRPDWETCHANSRLAQPDTLPRPCASSSLQLAPLPLPCRRLGLFCRLRRYEGRCFQHQAGGGSGAMASAGHLHAVVERRGTLHDQTTFRRRRHHPPGVQSDSPPATCPLCPPLCPRLSPAVPVLFGPELSR